MANFLSSSAPAPVSSLEQQNLPLPETCSSRRWVWVAVLLLVIVVSLFAPLAYAGFAARAHLELAKTALNTAYVQMSAQSFSGAKTSLEVARTEIGRARMAWRWVGPWGSVPWVSVQVQAIEHAMQAGTIGLDAAEDMLTALGRIQEAFLDVSRVPGLDPGVASSRAFQDLSRDEKRAILARFDQTLPQIRSAREKALIALETWNQIPQDRILPALRTAMEPITRALQAFRDRSGVVIDMAGLFVPMAGYPDPKTYIILLQNADELRATGGFIGTVGVMRIDSGEITDQSFQDVYAFDRTASSTVLGEPPLPLRRELGVASWYLRDSNWSPDVPQTAARISELFEKQGWLAQAVSSSIPLTADGVVFLQPGLFASLLRFAGPITVDGITFTPDGFFDELQYAVEIGFAKQGIPVEERKLIVGKLGEALLARVAAQPARRWLEVLDLGTQAFAHKDAMVVMRNPELQRAFDGHDWSGRAKGAAQDELWVVDTNLAALKTDGVMDKRVTYELDATNPLDVVATVRLTYTNTNRAITWRYTRYRDYVRIFVPEGSELVSSEGAMAKDMNQSGGRFIPGQVDVMKDLGKTVFGAFWSVEPGETRTLTFRYRLPERVSRPLLQQGSYQLLVQKQPGAKHRLTVDLRLGKKLIAATPAELPAEYGDDRYRVTSEVDTDKLFSVRVK